MRIVPARNGWLWLKDGTRLFGKAPVAWMLLVFSYYLVISILGALPFVGALAGVIAVPGFAASFMNVAREADRGNAVSPLLLFSGFRPQTTGILLLGVIYLVSLASILGISTLADGGDLARFLLEGKMPEPGEGVGGLVLAMFAYVPVLAAFWFAPPLVTWSRLAPAKAVFFSFFASLRNWAPMLVYAVATSAIIVVGTWIMLTVVQLLAPGASGGGRGPAAFAVFVFMPVVLSVVSIVFASFYSCYRDVFPDGHPAPGAAEPPEAAP